MGISAGAIRAADAFVSLDLDANPLSKGLRNVEKTLSKAASKIQTLGSQMVVLGSAISAPFAFAIREVASFDDQLKMLKAVTQGTTKELKALEKEIKKVGARSVSTAAEVAEGAKILGKAGFKRSAILNSLQSVVDLANATETPLADAADRGAKLMGAFNVDSGDKAAVIGFFDQLVYTTNNSAQSLEDLFETLKNFAPNAKAVGVATEEILAMSAALSNAGLTGTLAGTQIRRMFVNIADPKKAKLIKDLGIDVETASGKVKPLAVLFGELQRKFASMDLSKLKQLNLLNEVFGVRAGTGAKIMMQTLKELSKVSLDDFTADLRNVGGAAAETARIAREGLGNQLKLLWSAISAVAVEIGQALAPSIREVVKVMQGLQPIIVDWIKNHREVIVTIAKIGAALLAVGAGMVAFSATFYTASAAVGAVSASLTAVLFPVKKLMGVLQLLTGSTVKSMLVIRGSLEGVIQDFRGIGKWAGSFSGAAGVGMAKFERAIQFTRIEMLKLHKSLSAISNVKSVKKASFGFKTLTRAILFSQIKLTNLRQSFTRALDSSLVMRTNEGMKTLARSLGSVLVNIDKAARFLGGMPTLKEAFKQDKKTLVWFQNLNNTLQNFDTRIGNSAGKMSHSFRKMFPIFGRVEKSVETMSAGFKASFKAVRTGAAGNPFAAIQLSMGQLNKGFGTVTNSASKFGSTLKTRLSAVSESLKNLSSKNPFESAARGFGSLKKSGGRAASSFYEGFKSASSGLGKGIQTSYLRVINGISDVIINTKSPKIQVGGLGKNLKGAGSSAIKGIASTFKVGFKSVNLFTQAVVAAGRTLMTIGKLVGSIGVSMLYWKAAEMIVMTVVNTFMSLWNAIKGMLGPIKSLGGTLVEAFRSGEWEVFGATISAMWDTITMAVMNFIDDTYLRITAWYEDAIALFRIFWDPLYETATTVFTGITTGFKQMFAWFMSGLKSMAAWLDSIFGGNLFSSFFESADKDSMDFFNSFAGYMSVISNRLMKFGLQIASIASKADAYLKYGNKKMTKEQAAGLLKKEAEDSGKEYAPEVAAKLQERSAMAANVSKAAGDGWIGDSDEALSWLRALTDNLMGEKLTNEEFQAEANAAGGYEALLDQYIGPGGKIERQIGKDYEKLAAGMVGKSRYEYEAEKINKRTAEKTNEVDNIMLKQKTDWEARKQRQSDAKEQARKVRENREFAAEKVAEQQAAKLEESKEQTKNKGLLEMFNRVIGPGFSKAYREANAKERAKQKAAGAPSAPESAKALDTMTKAGGFNISNLAAQSRGGAQSVQEEIKEAVKESVDVLGVISSHVTGVAKGLGLI